MIEVPGFIYVIAPETKRRPDDDCLRLDARYPVKIGWTSGRPRYRLDSLQIGSPLPLTVVAVSPGTQADEKGLHSRFYRQRLRGERFSFETGGVWDWIVETREAYGIPSGRDLIPESLRGVVVPA